MKNILYRFFKPISLTLLLGTVLGFFPLTRTNAQELDFLLRLGDNAIDQAESIVVDSEGNFYILGNFQNTVNFNPQGGNSRTSLGQADLFLAKYDISGNFIWVIHMAASGADQVGALSMDKNGDLLIAGSFENNLFLISPTSIPTDTLTSNGNTDIFIAKFSPQGDYRWAFSIGGTNADFVRDIAVDAHKNIYITGSIQNTVDFDPSPVGVANGSSSGLEDIFLASYTSEGLYRRVFVTGYNTSTDLGYSVATDHANGVYISGVYSSISPGVDFDPSANTAFLNSQSSTQDGFVAKYDTLGNYQWAFSLGSSSGPAGDIAVETKTDQAGNVYVSGFFFGTVNFNPLGTPSNLTSKGNEDSYLAKYTTAGNLLWVKSIGGTGNDQSFELAVDNQNDVYVTGFFTDTMILDTIDTLQNQGNLDAFLVKYDSTGQLQWSTGLGGTEGDVGLAVAADNSGGVYVGGYFGGTVNFNPLGISSSYTSAGSSDAFVGRYKPFSSTEIFFDPDSLKGFIATNTQSSASQRFTISSGSDVSSLALFSALGFYEFSNDSITFSDTLYVDLLAEEPVMLYTRLKAQPDTGAYEDFLNFTGDTLFLSGEVKNPFISAITPGGGNTLSGFLATPTTASSTQTYTIQANDLAGDLLVSPLRGFYELSFDGLNFFDVVVYPQENAITSTLFVRLKANLPPGQYADTLLHESNLAEPAFIFLSGEVDSTPSISLEPDTLRNFQADIETASFPQVFEVRVNSPVSSLEIYSISGFYEFSNDSINFSDTLSVDLFMEVSVMLYTRLKPQLEPGPYNDLVVVSGDTLFLIGENVSDTQLVPPSNLKITVVDAFTVKIQWTDNTQNESFFVVERKDSVSGTFVEIAKLNSGTTSFMDSSLSSGPTYFYRVGAIITTDTSYSETLGVVTGVPTSVEDNFIRNSTKLLPNVSDNKVNLTMDNTYRGEVALSLVHISGQIMQAHKLNKTQNILNYSLDLADLSSGMYLIQIQTNQGSAVLRCLKN